MSALDVIEGRAAWCVIHGDNAEILPSLPAKSVDVVLQDPPYEAEAHTTQRRSGLSLRDVRAGQRGLFEVSR